jgi:hypothetical protein
MSTIATKNQNTYQLAPEGMHLARCVRVIDLGTQHNEYNGRTKKNRQIKLSWELPEHTAVFDKSVGPEPFLVSRTYTNSLGEKSNLYHDLLSWIGSGFTRQAEFNLSALLGQPCQLNVIHETSKNNRQYMKVIGILPVPKKMAMPEQILSSVLYAIEDGQNEVFESFPEYLQEKILASEELGGSRPTAEEIAERNVREATDNALKKTHSPAGADEPDWDAINLELSQPHSPVPLHQAKSDEPLVKQTFREKADAILAQIAKS